MTKQVLNRLGLGPVLLLVSGFAWFGQRQYSAWLAAPAPEVTWGCGAANVMPAGVHLPEKAAFNWWLLAAQLLLGILVVLLAFLIAIAVRLVEEFKFIPAPSLVVDFANATVALQPRKLVSNFVLINFGMRAPPVVVFA